MSIDSILVVAVIAIMLVLLYREILQPALIFLLGVLVFYLTGIINTGELFAGFSNDSVIMIFLLITISDIVKKTAAMDKIIHRFLKPQLSLKNYLFRMTGFVSFLSSWVNNTPLVAFMIPYTHEWAVKRGISPSKVLLPLSYAAIIGGTVTLIGTSTNLVVNGLAIEAGLPSLNLFDFIYVGIPAVIIGVTYIYLFGHKTLPARMDILSKYNEKSREYLFETLVPENSKLIGKTIKQARLRNLRGLYLAEIIRNDEVIAPVSPQITIQAGDRMLFAGESKTIIDLVEESKDLVLPFGDTMKKQWENNIVEVLIPNNSRLIGQTAKNSNFRKKYDSAIIAIQRNGEKVSGKIGEIELQSGDLLLMIAGKDFIQNSESEQDFLVISRVKQIEHIPSWKKRVFFYSLLVVFGLSVFKILSLTIGLMIVIGITALMKMVRFPELKKTVDLNLLFILVLALAMGKAISNSGLAQTSADFIMSMVGSNPVSIMAGLYLMTNLMTMFVTNAAAAAIMFPIAFAAGTNLHLANMAPFVLTIAYAASAEFLTPFGYQTNLMVYGPGGYQFKDYIKFGFPMTILYFILTIGILGLVYNLF